MSECSCNTGNICYIHGGKVVGGFIKSPILGQIEQDNRPDLFDEVIKLSKRVHVLERELADYKQLEINMSLRFNNMDKSVDEIKDILLKLAESGRLRGNG